MAHILILLMIHAGELLGTTLGTYPSLNACKEAGRERIEEILAREDVQRASGATLLCVPQNEA